MKCINCGHELEPGSGFCPECGMIMSLGSETETIKEPEIEVKNNQSTGIDDDFMAYLYEDEEVSGAKELEADETEQFVDVETYDEEPEEAEDILQNEENEAVSEEVEAEEAYIPEASEEAEEEAEDAEADAEIIAESETEPEEADEPEADDAAEAEDAV